MKLLNKLLPIFLAALMLASCRASPADSQGADSASYSGRAGSDIPGDEDIAPGRGETDPNYADMPKVKAVIGENEFTITLADNEAALNFKDMLPLTLDMSELNGNEKYCYTGYDFRNSPQKVSYINRGDLMLYGKDCVVLFYRSFSTSYSYTPLGAVDDVEGLALAVGAGGVTITFEIREE